MKLGAVPTMNLPVSHEKEKTVERRHINIVNDIEPSAFNKTEHYKNISSFERSVDCLKLQGWIVSKANNNFHFKSFTPSYNTPRIEVIVTTNLEFTILVYGWSLTNECFIYDDYHRSMKNVTIAKLLKQVKSYVVCEGLSNRVVEASVSVEHNVLCEVDLSLLEDGCTVQGKKYYRAKD